MMGTYLAPGTAALILFGIFFGAIFLRVPVAFCIGLAREPYHIARVLSPDTPS